MSDGSRVEHCDTSDVDNSLVVRSVEVRIVNQSGTLSRNIPLSVPD